MMYDELGNVNPRFLFTLAFSVVATLRFHDFISKMVPMIPPNLAAASNKDSCGIAWLDILKKMCIYDSIHMYDYNIDVCMYMCSYLLSFSSIINYVALLTL